MNEIVVAGVFFLARWAGEKKAAAMVDVASATGRDRRDSEAPQQLDEVQSRAARDKN